MDIVLIPGQVISTSLNLHEDVTWVLRSGQEHEKWKVKSVKTAPINVPIKPHKFETLQLDRNDIFQSLWNNV